MSTPRVAPEDASQIGRTPVEVRYTLSGFSDAWVIPGEAGLEPAKAVEAGEGGSQVGRTPVEVRYTLPGFSDTWLIEEGHVPESALHDACAELLKALLRAWIARTGRSAAVFRNMAVRLREKQPKVGFDPDICLVEPAPPGAEELSSLRVWEPGHRVPVLAVEVVSENHPEKDYVRVPEQCAAGGVGELVVFDPQLAGTDHHGGPYRLQVWQRTADGEFVRRHAGEGPAPSAVLDAFWVVTDGGRRLRVSSDEAGRELWLTAEEAERAEKEAERAEKEAERAEKEAALRRLAELEAELGRR